MTETEILDLDLSLSWDLRTWDLVFEMDWDANETKGKDGLKKS